MRRVFCCVAVFVSACAAEPPAVPLVTATAEAPPPVEAATPAAPEPPPVSPPAKKTVAVAKPEEKPALLAKPKRDDAAIIAGIIANSRASYSGKCGCPYDTDRAGRSCGGRSAYSRAGGRSVVCFPHDVTPGMIAAF